MNNTNVIMVMGKKAERQTYSFCFFALFWINCRFKTLRMHFYFILFTCLPVCLFFLPKLCNFYLWHFCWWNSVHCTYSLSSLDLHTSNQPTSIIKQQFVSRPLGVSSVCRPKVAKLSLSACPPLNFA